MIKHALILAAGAGLRLPSTIHGPKPLIKFSGSPIIVSLIEKIRDQLG